MRLYCKVSRSARTRHEFVRGAWRVRGPQRLRVGRRLSTLARMQAATSSAEDLLKASCATLRATPSSTIDSWRRRGTKAAFFAALQQHASNLTGIAHNNLVPPNEYVPPALQIATPPLRWLVIGDSIARKRHSRCRRWFRVPTSPMSPSRSYQSHVQWHAIMAICRRWVSAEGQCSRSAHALRLRRFISGRLRSVGLAKDGAASIRRWRSLL